MGIPFNITASGCNKENKYTQTISHSPNRLLEQHQSCLKSNLCPRRYFERTALKKGCNMETDPPVSTLTKTIWNKWFKLFHWKGCFYVTNQAAAFFCFVCYIIHTLGSKRDLPHTVCGCQSLMLHFPPDTNSLYQSSISVTTDCACERGPPAGKEDFCSSESNWAGPEGLCVSLCDEGEEDHVWLFHQASPTGPGDQFSIRRLLFKIFWCHF